MVRPFEMQIQASCASFFCPCMPTLGACLGGIPEAVDGAFPVLTSLAISTCNLASPFPLTWGEGDGMFGGLQSLVLSNNS